MKIPFSLYQKIRFKLNSWNEFYILVFVLGIFLITLFGVLADFEKRFSWILWTGIFLETISIAFSFFTDNLDELFEDKVK
ncbi:MAG: hypothetical protein IPL26_00090 [Leptospiraceae bacterium]|nr:hypothetical protein [Leptospiraceae bacterium]